MNSLNSLYFPGTTINSIAQFPVFLLFSNIYIIRAAESNIYNDDHEPADSFINSGFCQVHTPCPLGDDLDRFIHLVNDIKNRKDDYASQLSGLTLASMSTSSQNSGDSQQEILSSLLNVGGVVPDKKAEENNLQLWQARLVLAIGEMLDLEEEEIAKQLAMLKDEEAGLFKELQGEQSTEEENPFEELSLIQTNMIPANPENIKKRFLSWKRIFSEATTPQADLLLTTSKDAADLIFESFEHDTGDTALFLGQLPLPALAGWNEKDALESITSFQENNKELKSKITEVLAEQKSNANLKDLNDSDSIFARLSKQWEESLEIQFPTDKFGRLTVRFYGFANSTGTAVLGLKQHENNSNNQNCLLAVADTHTSGI